MYVVLTGAKKNLGDFLITDRCEALLREFRPDQELVQQPSWKPLDLDLAAKADAVIILGGPGYQPQMVPRTYPLSTSLEDIPCPVVPMGLGWKGVPGDAQTEREYAFSDTSLRALQWMQQKGPGLSCRDWVSEAVLRRHGLRRTVMTGCPVWYDLPSIGQSMRLPAEVRRVVFTPAQLDLFAAQSVDVARVVAEMWPNAEKICAFHRGIAQSDEFTPQRDIDNNLRLAAQVKELGFEVRDVSGSTEKTEFYRDCDLHVGYRVHAHIYFLSVRLPSLLLHEDGRGRGASLALGLEGIDGFKRPLATQLASVAVPRRLQRAVQRVAPPYVADSKVAERVRVRLQQDVASRFARCAGVGARIDAQLGVMGEFLKALP